MGFLGAILYSLDCLAQYNLTPLFARLPHALCEVSFADMEQIERFVVPLYHWASALNQVNEARFNLFTQNRKMDNFPTTFHALDQHLKRVKLAKFGDSVLFQTFNFHHNICGVRTRQLMTIRTSSPCWSTHPEAARDCQELLKCGCKKACSKRCGCVKANLLCTNLCYCSEQCIRDSMI